MADTSQSNNSAYQLLILFAFQFFLLLVQSIHFLPLGRILSFSSLAQVVLGLRARLPQCLPFIQGQFFRFRFSWGRFFTRLTSGGSSISFPVIIGSRSLKKCHKLRKEAANRDSLRFDNSIRAGLFWLLARPVLGLISRCVQLTVKK